MYLLSYLDMNRNISVVLLVLSLLALATAQSKYRVVSVQTTPSTVTLGLKYTGTEDYYLKPSNPIIKDLLFTIHAYTQSDLSFKITDAKNQRFEVPQQGIFPSDPFVNFSYPLNYSQFKFTYTANPFDFKVHRRAIFSQNLVFSSHGGEMIFSEHYLQITNHIKGDIYGLGGRFNEQLKIKNGKWTLFNRDRGQVIDQGQGLQTYSYHPIYFMVEEERYQVSFPFHISYFRSSNAMDIIQRSDNGKKYLTYKVIGGIFDFRIIAGLEPEIMFQRLMLYLGRSQIPPFWSLGFHQSRRGYSDVSALEKVIQGYEQNGLPLDGIWSDIDYMINYEDFTIDETRFPLDRMAAITAKYHYIPVIGGGIRVNGTAHTEGKKRDVFIKDADGSELHGKSWAGKVAFVDFFHPNATKYWADMLDSLYSKVKFSGIWLTNNEYSNFCDGPCQPPSGPSKFDYSKDLPYNPGSDSIQSKTIPLNSTHYGNRTQANVHVFNGFLQTYATNSFLRDKGMRPFVLSRSTTLGSNKYGFHWTGDNYASFQFLKGSLADMMINQLLGFHVTGADICGYGGDTTQQLCSRWYQLGALYPFSRNNNAQQSLSQQPYALGQTVLEAAKTNLRLRYSLLKHFYSLFILKKGFGGIINPIYARGQSIQQYFNSQFLIGDNIMAAPILEQGKTTRSVLFQDVFWFDMYTGQLFQRDSQQTITVQLTDKVPLYLVQGTMVLTQKTENVKSTKDLDSIFTLTAAFITDDTSNQTHQYYSSVGTHISLRDYNDQVKVDLCLSLACQYIFNLLVSSNPQNKTLTLNINYLGPAHLDQKLEIDEINLYSDSWVIMEKLDTNIKVKGNQKIVVPVGKNTIKRIPRNSRNIRIKDQ